jgi:hypothetical protein
MTFEEWQSTERKALEAINEFSQMGIKIRTGRGTPITTATILADQTARAFDHAIEEDLVDQGFGFRGRSAVDDDEVDEHNDGYDAYDEESSNDRELRAAMHRTLDRCLATLRAQKNGRRLNDAEKQDLQLMKSLLTARNSIPPWDRFAARAADADEGGDLQYFKHLAFKSCGVR